MFLAFCRSTNAKPHLVRRSATEDGLPMPLVGRREQQEIVRALELKIFRLGEEARVQRETRGYLPFAEQRAAKGRLEATSQQLADTESELSLATSIDFELIPAARGGTGISLPELQDHAAALAAGHADHAASALHSAPNEEAMARMRCLIVLDGAAIASDGSQWQATRAIAAMMLRDAAMHGYRTSTVVQRVRTLRGVQRQLNAWTCVVDVAARLALGKAESHAKSTSRALEKRAKLEREQSAGAKGSEVSTQRAVFERCMHGVEDELLALRLRCIGLHYLQAMLRLLLELVHAERHSLFQAVLRRALRQRQAQLLAECDSERHLAATRIESRQRGIRGRWKAYRLRLRRDANLRNRAMRAAMLKARAAWGAFRCVVSVSAQSSVRAQAATFIACAWRENQSAKHAMEAAMAKQAQRKSTSLAVHSWFDDRDSTEARRARVAMREQQYRQGLPPTATDAASDIDDERQSRSHAAQGPSAGEAHISHHSIRLPATPFDPARGPLGASTHDGSLPSPQCEEILSATVPPCSQLEPSAIREPPSAITRGDATAASGATPSACDANHGCSSCPVNMGVVGAGAPAGDKRVCDDDEQRPLSRAVRKAAEALYLQALAAAGVHPTGTAIEQVGDGEQRLWTETAPSVHPRPPPVARRQVASSRSARVSSSARQKMQDGATDPLQRSATPSGRCSARGAAVNVARVGRHPTPHWQTEALVSPRPLSRSAFERGIPPILPGIDSPRSPRAKPQVRPGKVRPGSRASVRDISGPITPIRPDTAWVQTPVARHFMQVREAERYFELQAAHSHDEGLVGSGSHSGSTLAGASHYQASQGDEGLTRANAEVIEYPLPLLGGAPIRQTRSTREVFHENRHIYASKFSSETARLASLWDDSSLATSLVKIRNSETAAWRAQRAAFRSGAALRRQALLEDGWRRADQARREAAREAARQRREQEALERLQRFEHEDMAAVKIQRAYRKRLSILQVDRKMQVELQALRSVRSLGTKPRLPTRARARPPTDHLSASRDSSRASTEPAPFVRMSSEQRTERMVDHTALPGRESSVLHGQTKGSLSTVLTGIVTDLDHLFDAGCFSTLAATPV